MDSYIVRIYRRAGRKARILVGTVEVAGSGRKMAFSNIEELWEILRRPKDRGLCAPSSVRRRLRKEVMSGTAETGLEESAEGVRPIKPTLGDSFSFSNEKGK
jgi:hypothetical protein